MSGFAAGRFGVWVLAVSVRLVDNTQGLSTRAED